MIDPTAETDPQTRVHSTVERLRHDIVGGALSPGARLKIRELQDNYAVGANSLREALTALVADGLVEMTAQRGFRVAEMSLADLQDVMRIRQALECLALEWSIRNGDDDWEASVIGAYHKLAKVERVINEAPAEYGAQWEARNAEFHATLIARCPSARLLHFREIVYAQSVRYRMSSLTSPAIHRDEDFTEHKAICDAALERDAARASKLLAEHIIKEPAAYGGEPAEG